MASGIDVSFIIAAYNAEAFLAGAIESALAQNGVTVEVVAADDRSSDRTVDIARQYAGHGVRVVELPENAGPAGARNAALAEARGAWIAVLDADDALRPERSRRMITLGERTGAEIVVDNLAVSRPDGSSRPMYPAEVLRRIGHIDLPAFILANRVFRSTDNFGYMKPMIRRSFVEAQQLRYDEALRIGEDYVFLATALAGGGRCAVDPEPGYVYRVREGSISGVLESGHVEAMLKADAAFGGRHRLDARAAAAMRKRRRNLREAAAYLAIVDHIKSRSPARLVATGLRHPSALRLLGMPLGVRLRRLASRLPALRIV